jgi:hypothetical protein
MRAFASVRNTTLATVTALGVLAATGCKHDEPAAQYPTYPAQPAAPGQPTSPGQPAAPGAAAFAGQDPINATDLVFLRAEASAILRELVLALPPLQQGRVANIPLVVDSTPGEVNAFAACTKSGRAAMAVTDGLFDIQAHLARAKAYDELARTNKVGEYIGFIARTQQPKLPIVRPPPGFFEPAFDNQPNKLLRQRELLDEQLAFVLGHELAHHYLGHLPCTGSGHLAPAEIARVLADAVPLFNQPNEIAADISGLNDALTAGARRAGYHFTEGGALLTMQFFSGVDQFSAMDILFAFERAHPPPALRSPIIVQTANAWRATGGRGLPYPLF